MARMTRIYLHNYLGSPFAEKARLMLSYKNLPWTWVEIPRVMPKPDLVALTGGYRKTPVMQVGRDIYCDTRVIQLYLEKVQPEPSFFAAGHEALCLELAHWADTSWFRIVVGLAFSPQGMASFLERMTPQEAETLFADRSALRGNAPLPAYEDCKMAFTSHARRLDAQLAKRPFLIGERLSLVDIAHYHPLFLLGNLPAVAVELDPYPHLRDWIARVRELGWGEYEQCSGDAALELARSADAWTDPLDGEALALPHVKLGQLVSVAATDTGTGDVVTGELAILGPNEIAVRRTDPRAGEVTVHFPTLDFHLAPA